MRSGVVVNIVRKEDTNEHELAQMMIGHEIIPPERDTKLDYENLPTVLEFKNVTLQPKDSVPVIDNVSFSVHEGEVFGIAGVSGNGQDELCDVLSGIRQMTGGDILFRGKSMQSMSIRERIESGMGYVPVDRYRDAMEMDMTLAENMLLKASFDPKWIDKGFIRKKELDEYTRKVIKDHAVKATGPDDLARSLSGGNQQKVVLGREVDLGKSLMVFNQPTRGLDMGAVDRIHKVILNEKENKKAILLISTELTEIFGLCDRIAVMYKGRFMGIYRNGELTTSQIGLLMAGIEQGAAK